LEHGSEVWDDCGAGNSDRLGKVQIEAARFIWFRIHYVRVETRIKVLYILLQTIYITKIRMIEKSIMIYQETRIFYCFLMTW